MLKITFAAVFISTFVWYILWRSPMLLQVGQITIDFGAMELNLRTGRTGHSVLKGRIAALLDTNLPQARLCEQESAKQYILDETCIELKEQTKLSIVQEKLKNVQCYHVKWQPLTSDFIPMDCYHINGTQWYGGAEMYDQRWPINEQRIDLKPYLSGDYLQDVPASTDRYGSILERLWISAQGVGIYVDNNVPLHVSLKEYDENNPGLCLKADYLDSPYRNPERKHPVLSYTICRANNVKTVVKYMHLKFYKKPLAQPDERMFKSPIWSTWAKYKVHINQTSVLKYAEEINLYGFPNSQIEIDDMWSPEYGELNFDKIKFPDPRGMVTSLKKMGFRVTAWMTPFSNVGSQSFLEGMQAGYWVKDGTGHVPGLIQWWQGIGGVLDVTNPRAVRWFVRNLDRLRDDFGIDSFKFDAGETCFIPSRGQTFQSLLNPGDFTTQYAGLVASFGDMVEMRSAYRSQQQPIFVRMMDKDSLWGYDNGLKTMIPTALLLSILGYPFILPDMIGGNGYGAGDSLRTSVPPDKELFIRWTELTAYLPSMQFSFVPWQYDNETITISRDMIRQHEQVVTPIVLKAAEKSVSTGNPIIRPLWWLDPMDKVCLQTDSEFLVGDNLLVAPILDMGARRRDIYLPRGEWQDNLRGGIHTGQTWLTNYAVELHEIATFTRKI